MATALALETTTEVTLTNANELYEVTFPLEALSFTVQPRTNDAKVVMSGGTDGAAIGSTDFVAHPADSAAAYPVPGTRGNARSMVAARRKVWLASASAGTVVEVTPWRHPYASGG